MSIKVLVYVPFLTAELLPGIAARFEDFGMQCQFHPAFALDSARDSGSVSVCLTSTACPLAEYEQVRTLSGFDISFKRFEYRAPLAVSPQTNEKLKGCKHIVEIRMHALPTNAVRCGLYFSGFLAQLTDGIVYMPRSDKYLEASEALEQIREDVANYEMNVPIQDWTLVRFANWN